MTVRELPPVTWLLCSDCGRRIPYDQPYVRREIRKGGQLLDGQDLCMECASK
ncbi:unnamed protein product [marine sediment metagenome]|uniref:Uncharacterized protein n=1 Tax=marine sediment metagenome TaxID=412755 RepID=X0S0P2_9ZZZZ